MTMLLRELVQQGEKLASYLDALSGIGIVFIDSALNIQDCNQGFTRMFHLEKKPIGSPVADFLMLGDNDLNHAEDLKLSCSSKSGVNGILHCRPVVSENGCLLFCERLMLTESRVIEQIGVINNELINLQRESVKKNLLLEKLRRELDERVAELEATITELNRIEAENAKLDAQTRQLQKSESLGRMAGAIAHTFNNQLGVVIGNLEMAIDEMPKCAGQANQLTAAMRAAQKAAEVSGQMLTYLGQSFDKRVLLDLAEVCRRNLPIIEAAMPGTVTLETNLPSPGPAVMANAIEIQQVLTNLITNAWETVGTGQGSIHLNVKTVSPADIPQSRRFPVDWQPQVSAYACLEVADTGDGIADEDIENLFDPFFSSKFTGRGMGLPVVLGVVKAHGGAITVESELGRGSIFGVILPVSAEQVLRQPDKEEQVPVFEGGGTILLVDDEEMVRNMAAAMLNRLGFSVLKAKDGVEAVEVFRQHQDEIRCVLTDLTMPRMNGWETLMALRKLVPGISVILASGYDKANVMSGDHPELPQAFLGKPYRLKGLSDAISQAMVRRK